MTAALSGDGRFVLLQGNLWSESFLVADLPGKLRFYRRLSERGGNGKGGPGPYARYYLDTLAALLAVAKAVAA